MTVELFVPVPRSRRPLGQRWLRVRFLLTDPGTASVLFLTGGGGVSPRRRCGYPFDELGWWLEGSLGILDVCEAAKRRRSSFQERVCITQRKAHFVDPVTCSSLEGFQEPQPLQNRMGLIQTTLGRP